MEFFSFIALAGFVLVCGLVTGTVTARLVRDFERGRGELIVAGFFVPALFVTYLFLASHLREEFHRWHSEAYCLDPNCTIPLGHGVELSYYDDMPSIARITRDGLDLLGFAPPTYVQGTAIVGNMLYTETSHSTLSIDPPDGFLSLNLVSGEVRKFTNDRELRANALGLGQLTTPDQILSTEENRQRNRFYWPTVFAAPILLAATMLIALSRRKSKKPTGIPAGL